MMFRPMNRFVKLFKSLKFTYLSLFLIGLSAIFLFSFMYSGVKQETFELKEFHIAQETIRSIKTVEDTVKTEEERERAALEVSPFYQFSEAVAKNQQAIISSLFDLVIEVKKSADNDLLNPDVAIKTRKDLVQEFRKKSVSLEEEEPAMRLSDEAISNLLAQDLAVLLSTQKTLVAIIGEELSKPVRTSDLTAAKNEIERKLRPSVSIPANVLQTVISIGRSAMVETETVNEESDQGEY